MVGSKRVVRSDDDYEEPNIIIPREIAKMCTQLKYNKVKRYTLTYLDSSTFQPVVPVLTLSVEDLEPNGKENKKY